MSQAGNDRQGSKFFLPRTLSTSVLNTVLPAPLIIEMQGFPLTDDVGIQSIEPPTTLGLGVIIDATGGRPRHEPYLMYVPTVIRSHSQTYSTDLHPEYIADLIHEFQCWCYILKCTDLRKEEVDFIKFLTLTLPIPLIAQVDTDIGISKINSLINSDISGLYIPRLPRPDLHYSFRNYLEIHEPEFVVMSDYDETDPLLPFRQGADIAIVSLDYGNARESIEHNIQQRITDLSASLSVIGMTHPRNLTSIIAS